jgi:hypothetical protein
MPGYYRSVPSGQKCPALMLTRMRRRGVQFGQCAILQFSNRRRSKYLSLKSESLPLIMLGYGPLPVMTGKIRRFMMLLLLAAGES